MFEKADPFSTALRRPFLRRAEDGARLRTCRVSPESDRFESRLGRRAGDALRAIDWSEITARLNAARDLRLLMRSESQGRIEAVAASFGDAAASYLAMIDDHELEINHDALDCPKVSDGIDCARLVATCDAVSEGGAGRVTDAPSVAMQETDND